MRQGKHDMAGPEGQADQRIPVRRVLHTIHAVRDVHVARKLYQDVFGAIAFAERYHAGEDRDMALLYAADHMIEPMAPADRTNRTPPSHATSRNMARASTRSSFGSTMRQPQPSFAPPRDWRSQPSIRSSSL